MSVGALLALTGPVEVELVQALDAPGTGVRVVRRCADVPEVLAAAAAGLGAVVVLSADLPGVDRTVVARLHAAGVAAVLVAQERDRKRCAALGADRVEPAETPVVALADVVVALARAAGRQGPAGPTPPDGPGARHATADGGPARRTAAGIRGGRPTGRDESNDGRVGGAPGDRVPPTDDGRADDTGDGDAHTETPDAGADYDPTAGAWADYDPAAGAGADGHGPAAGAGADDHGPAAGAGRLVAVWGPPGAPGRTTVAVTLAAELAALAGTALLVDADTEAPSVTQVLGLLDDSSAIAVVARQATHGRLDATTLERVCPVIDGGLRVLTGLTRADRWRELPPAALEVVWEVARRTSPWTVVDTGSGFEVDGGFDQAFGPQRHQATVSALAAADVVVVVGAGEPVGIRRLVMALGELGDRRVMREDAERVVVVNRVRASAAGPRAAQSIHEALARFAGVGDAVLVPDDRPALDKAVLHGRTLTQAAPSSAARAALHELARRLVGDRPAGPVRRRRRRALLGARAG
ncbi:hypothetical protein [Georgenia sp. SYP-B2076]|uniref:hypothetical protein n=1 Tax=Georgenia sp. SYP-B2076 TaxID=2495881 RepID=UPI000F8E5036|nr:hypothetical protein [Georgenia sp. SYP-B2076]